MIRVPRITGFPIIIAGLISIRSVVIAIPMTHHSAPARVAQSHLATSSTPPGENTSSIPGPDEPATRLPGAGSHEVWRNRPSPGSVPGSPRCKSAPCIRPGTAAFNG